ncbi:MAG TPA: 16S rRNA (guanine(966)-N(2))-methyltransferase RsmD [Candidatus Saccharimonadales bacterium]|nr:16S rRNA (guanine(966)-N(2))-methyltransferase RsmD [Candidatus Saccharimonadales bacterium]
MRVVSGSLKGRPLVSPSTRLTRPMTAKTRGALFDILGPIDGLSVLDAYAGSGALGIEAISRGADSVIAIELGSEAIDAIRKNNQNLNLGHKLKLAATRVESWLDAHSGQKFDLIFAMPPYSVLDRHTLSRLGHLLNPEGVLVVEYPRQEDDFELEDIRLVKVKKYGDPQLAFYKNLQVS